MAVVSTAIILSFHLKSQPTPLERRIAVPLGLVFWLLALACVGLGMVNYIRCVRGYAKRQALVQTGLSTQIVSSVDFPCHFLHSIMPLWPVCRALRDTASVTPTSVVGLRRFLALIV